MPIPPRTPLITLMRLETKHVASLNKVLTGAVKDLDKKIAGMANANPITMLQAQAQRAAMKDFLGQTFDTVEDVASRGMLEAARAASGVVSQYEDELLKLVLDPKTMGALAKSEAKRAAAGLEAALKRMQGTSYKPLSKTVYDSKQLANGWVDNTINKALASGWSRQQLAAELKKSINPKTPGGVSYAANRTARTEINNAFHASSAERYMNSVIVESVDWHLSSSHPEGDVCDMLQDESPYPKKSVPQKPHPNCYCYITPHLPTEEEFLEKLFNGDYDPKDAPWVNETPMGPMTSGIKVPDMTMKRIFEDGSDMEKATRLRDVYDGREFGNMTFNGRDLGPFRLDVGHVSVQGNHALMNISIMTNAGPMGNITRTFNRLPDGSFRVTHDIMELTPMARGQGFSTAFSEFSETWYRKAGISQIDVHAGLSDGGYAWAKAGYDWNTSSGQGVVHLSEKLNAVRSKLTYSVIKENEALIDAEIWLHGLNEKVSDLMRATVSGTPDELARAYAAMPRPYEIANKSYPGLETLGRDLLAGTDWIGVKVL